MFFSLYGDSGSLLDGDPLLEATSALENAARDAGAYLLSDRSSNLESYFEELRSMCARHVAILARNGYADVDQAQELTLRPLGVSVAWVDKDFKEVPDRLESLYKAGGDDWDKVFKVEP